MHPNRYSRLLALEEKQPRQWAALAQTRSAAVEGARPQGNMVPSSNLTRPEVETWLVVNGNLVPLAAP